MAAAIVRLTMLKKHRHTDFFGEMKGSFIALNVYAYEVSCRAGTIKCSRERQKRRALAPIRHRRKIGSPADPTQVGSFGRQNCASKLIDTYLQIKPSGKMP